LGLTVTVTSLLLGAGIIGLALDFAFQYMAENVFGLVKTINLRNTLVETFFGQIDVIPNKILFRNARTNYTTTGCRRIEVPVGISYEDDQEKAAGLIEKSINTCDFVIKKKKLPYLLRSL
jgi:small-conductance mechanosensitive channel